jgi:hypothetical protein
VSRTVTTKTFMEKLEPGSVYSEEYVVSVDRRDPHKHAAEAGPRVFAFRYFDIVTTEAELVGGGMAKIGSEKANVSGFYYIDAEELTVGDLIAEAAGSGLYNILISNMEGNGWDTVFRCRTGNFRPKEDGDTVVSS